MFFKIYWQILGGHCHMKWFAGPSLERTMGKMGDLCCTTDEWRQLKQIMQNSHVELIQERN